MALTLLELQSHFGDNPVKFQVVCPQIGTAVLKGLNRGEGKNSSKAGATINNCLVPYLSYWGVPTVVSKTEGEYSKNILVIILRGTIVNKTKYWY